jgi:hypothetical protein
MIYDKIITEGGESRVCVNSTSCGPSVKADNRALNQTTLYRIYTTTSQSESVAFSDLKSFLASFIVIGVQAQPAALGPPPEETPGVQAEECAFQYCIQTYDAAASFGKVSQTLVNTTGDLDYFGFDLHIGDNPTAKRLQALNGTVYGTIYSFNNSTNEIVNRFYDVMGPASIASSIAASLSLYFHLNSFDHTAPGIIWLNEIRVNVVAWPWIAGPAFVVLFSVLFLVWIIFHSRGKAKRFRHLGIWKNNALALLFHGFDQNTQTHVGPGCTIVDMENMARKTLVTLDEGNETRSCIRKGPDIVIDEAIELTNISQRHLKNIFQD